MSNSTCALAAFIVAALLCSCKTERKETWTSKSADSANPFGARMFGSMDSARETKAAEADLAAAKRLLADKPKSRRGKRQLKKASENLITARANSDHPLNAKRGSGNGGADGIFGGKEVGKKSFGKKEFQSKSYGGNEKFDANSYHFMKQREMSREAAAAAEKSYLDGKRQAGDGSKRWFGSKKSVEREGFAHSERRFNTSGYRTSGYSDAEKSQERNRDGELDVINAPGTGLEPRAMSVDDVKTILGR